MSKILKIVLALAVLLIVAGGLYFWFMHRDVAPTDAIPQAESEDTLPTGKDTSDTSLTADMKAMDSQMDSFSGDNASIDASISDTQVEQSSI